MSGNLFLKQAVVTLDFGMTLRIVLVLLISFGPVYYTLLNKLNSCHTTLKKNVEIKVRERLFAVKTNQIFQNPKPNANETKVRRGKYF